MSVPAPSAPPLPRSSPRICGAAFSEGLGLGVAALPHPPGPSLLSSASEAADTHWFSRLSPPRAGFLPDEKWRSAGFRPRRCGDFRRKHRTGCSPVPRPPRRPPPRPAELWLRTPPRPGRRRQEGRGKPGSLPRLGLCDGASSISTAVWANDGLCLPERGAHFTASVRRGGALPGARRRTSELPIPNAQARKGGGARVSLSGPAALPGWSRRGLLPRARAEAGSSGRPVRSWRGAFGARAARRVGGSDVLRGLGCDAPFPRALEGTGPWMQPRLPLEGDA